MKGTSVVVISVFLVLCFGCRRSDSGSNEISAESVSPKEIPAEVQICQNNCEIAPEMKVIPLNQNEQKSLGDAVKQNHGALTGATHLHIDAKDGQLTFGTDQDPAHVAAPGAQIKIQSVPPMKAVLSPGAQDLVRKRAEANMH